MRATMIALLATGLAALAFLSGCGQDEVKADNAYVAATDQAVQSFETRFAAQQARFTPVSTPAQDLATLATLRASVDRAVADLSRIKPPARIAALHAELVRRVGDYAAVVRTAEAGFGSRNPRVVIAARNRFSSTLATVAAKITATINTINAKLR